MGGSMINANRYRGEIIARLDGRKWQLCLTLGALAELETCLGEPDLGGLTTRFSSGKMSANDIIAIILAGLRGGGHDVQIEEVQQMRADNAMSGFIQIVTDLLEATFGLTQPDDPQSSSSKEFENPILP